MSDQTKQTLTQLSKDLSQAANIPSSQIDGELGSMYSDFAGNWNIQDKFRSLQLTFVNLSNKTILYQDSYFSSGTWVKNWHPEIPPLSIVQATVANRQRMATGVTGGLKLKVSGEKTFLYLGFTNPSIGSYKDYGEISDESKEARYGYDQCYDNEPKRQVFRNYKLQVVQTESKIAMAAFVYEFDLAENDEEH